jgi:hypothetical protein
LTKLGTKHLNTRIIPGDKVSEMVTIYLVSCVSAKLHGTAPAKDLYVSDWFRKARKYVETQTNPWYILSAKYGLVSPEQQLSPYDETLNKMPVSMRRQWAQRVLGKLTDILADGDTVVFLAGKRYREFLIEPLKLRGVNIVIPMDGLGIGQQKAWLKKKLHLKANCQAN